jgi:thiol-disulfide isomerase/thioredoxin
VTRLAALPALLLAVTLLAACGQETGPTGATPTTPATSGAQEPAPTKAGKPAKDDAVAPVPDTLDFTATTVGGETFEGATLAGRPVLLWFWAPWCPTCRGQVPQVEGLAAEHQGDLAVVGVGSLDSEEAIAEFAGGVEGLTHLVDTEGALWQRFGVVEQSSFVLLDADGEVAFEAGYGGSDVLGDQVADVVG